MLGENSTNIKNAMILLLTGRISPKLTSMSPTSKGVFPAIYRLSIEKIPAVICKFLDWPVKAIVTVQMHSLLEQTDSRVYNMPLTVNVLMPIFHQKANLVGAHVGPPNASSFLYQHIGIQKLSRTQYEPLQTQREPLHTLSFFKIFFI